MDRHPHRVRPRSALTAGLWLVLLLASMTAGGCCDPFSFAMFLHAATDVSTRDLYGDSGPMLLKTDAFIMAGPFEQTLARPGARFGVPPSVGPLAGLMAVTPGIPGSYSSALAR